MNMRSRMGAAALLTLAAGAAALSAAPASKKTSGGFALAACSDSEGASTSFYCAPRTIKGAAVKACATSARELGACQSATAQGYCLSRDYRTAQSFKVDAAGNLAELVCTRPVAAAVAVAEWLPMFDANIMGYDRREFGLKRGEDWKRCKAACEMDGGCQAWTVSRENNTCYLKWDGNPELVSYNACCITGIKGMVSGGPPAARARLRETGGS